MFQTSVVEIKPKDKFYVQQFVFSLKIMPFMRKCGKIWYSRKGHRWQYNRAHALFILGEKDYRHTLRICYTSYFSTSAMVTRSRLTVTFFVNCLSCLWAYVKKILISTHSLTHLLTHSKFIVGFEALKSYENYCLLMRHVVQTGWYLSYSVPWTWRPHVLAKRRYSSTRLHEVTSQNRVVFKGHCSVRMPWKISYSIYRGFSQHLNLTSLGKAFILLLDRGSVLTISSLRDFKTFISSRILLAQNVSSHYHESRYTNGHV